MSKTIKINQDHLTLKEFSHNITTNIVVEVYSYNNKAMTLADDISNMVVDYSYNCTSTDNIHMTANLTLNTDLLITRPWLKLENKLRTEYAETLPNGAWNIGDMILRDYYHYCFRLIKTYTDNDTNETNQIDLGYFVATDYSLNFESTTNEITLNLSGFSVLYTKEYGGTVFTMRVGRYVEYIDPKTLKTSTRLMTLPTTLAIEKGTRITPTMLFDTAMGSNRTSGILRPLNSVTAVPLTGAWIDYGQRVDYIAEDMDFDADISRGDQLQEIMDYAFTDGTFWVDENRILHMSSRPPDRGGVELFWKDYGELFLTENTSYNDSGYYNITEVYGRDNEYYGLYEGEIFNNGETLIFTRKQIICDDTLLSDEECYDRAVWETHKSLNGHQTWTITISDNYIKQFNKPSLIVGERVEYTNVDGDTNLYLLNKLSYSSNTWTMELILFKPMYEKMTTDFSDVLLRPTIYSHEIIDNKYIRLYVTGEDIENGLVKIFYKNYDTFRCESCKVVENGSDRYVDIEITGNGKYYFFASLYSPYYYDSGRSDSYLVTVEIPEERKDTDPYPHPPMYEDEGGHLPYLLNSQLQILTDNDGNCLTT